MLEHRYAGWVEGIFLQLVTEEESSDKSFQDSSLYRFFTRDDSKHKLKTLYSIAQAKSSTPLTSPVLELEAFEVLRILLNEMEHHYVRYRTVNKKELTRSLDQFEKAANNLCDVLDFTHSYHAFDLIEDAPAMWVSKSTSNMSDHEVELIEALKKFWTKTTRQVFLEYSNRARTLGTGNPYYLVNNREPTTSQLKIRLSIYLIIALVGLEAIGKIEKLGAFITHLMVILSPEFEDLERNDVNKLIKTAIKICDLHGQPITME